MGTLAEAIPISVNQSVQRLYDELVCKVYLSEYEKEMLETYRQQLENLFLLTNISNSQKNTRRFKYYYLEDLYDSLLTNATKQFKKLRFKLQVRKLSLQKQQFLLNLLKEGQLPTITRQTIVALENAVSFYYKGFF